LTPEDKEEFSYLYSEGMKARFDAEVRTGAIKDTSETRGQYLEQLNMTLGKIGMDKDPLVEQNATILFLPPVPVFQHIPNAILVNDNTQSHVAPSSTPEINNDEEQDSKNIQINQI
jgi:hypothetical protein